MQAEPSREPDEAPSATPTQAPTDSPQASPTWTPTPPAPESYLPEFAACGSSCPLPPPRTETGIPLMRALSLRASARAFRADELPLQVLSDLLWAAFGVNRPGGKRTAPSAYDVQDIEVYLAAAKGLFVYDASGHRLLPILAEDLRAATGSQAFVATAPANLVYVSDSNRLAAAGLAGEDASMFSWAHSGFIAQNVYLYCASQGLATVVRSTVNRAELAGRLGLAESRRVTLVQTVGYAA
jgi:nitroreductase